MATVIRFNRPGRGDTTSPTAAERWVLARVRDELGRQSGAGEAWEDAAWGHHEDEELGLPPLATRAGLTITLPQFTAQLTTAYWHAPADDAVSLQVHALPGGPRADDPKIARFLAGLGLQTRGAWWETTWRVQGEQDQRLVEAIVRLVAELACTTAPVEGDRPEGSGAGVAR